MADDERVASLGENLVKHDLITREELAQAQAREAASGIPWYRQLLQMGKVSFNALEDVLKHEFHPRSVRQQHETLGQVLVKLRAITEKQLEAALEEQVRTGRLLGNILHDRGLVTRQTINKALSKQHGLEYAELDLTRQF